MNVHIVGYETESGVLRILKVVKSHLNRLHYLLEHSYWLTELTHIYHKDECGIERCASLVSLGCREFIGTKLQLRSLLLVSSLPEFIKLRLIIDWHLVGVETQVTGSFSTTLYELHVRVDVGFASVTTEGPFLPMIN